MAVSFLKHKDALMKAWKDVSDEKSSTDWAVFGYEGKSYELKVVETGEDGLEEMVEELSGSKIMYAYCRVVDPNTNLPKFVLINWQGEGAPTNVKGTCARHTVDVAKLLRGAHVTINARTEDDVEPESILDKVSKASGSNYSFHKEKSVEMVEPGPVSSVYKRTNAAAEIKAKRSDKFWSETERAEEQRRIEEKKKQSAELEKIDAERRKREEKEASQRDAKMADKMRSVEQQKQQEKKTLEQQRQDEQLRWENKQKQQEADPSRTRPGGVSSRTKEAAEMVAQRGENPRATFEQRGSEPPPPASRPEPRAMPAIPAPGPEPEPKTRYEPEPEPQYEPEPEPEPEEQYEPEPEPQYEPEPEPQYEPEPEPEPEEQYEPEPEEVPPTDSWGGEEAAVDEGGAYDDGPPPAGDGQSARAVYDYQAADDTEITFDPDDIITDIEQLDPGWWRGTAPDGTNGMFPANYVELI
ncbi:drebrin-like protein B [Asterias amurensis]|uniref:drebrin-like protein B n=1 Tax=Asterias amurensis TaxID=7602 RepID=UPI003AB2C5D7